jgi:hypothetical protein
MLLLTGLGLAVGGTATTAVLLALAYTLYRLGTAADSAAAVRQYNDDRQYNVSDRQYNNDRTATAAAEPGGSVLYNTKQQQAEEGDESGEGFYEPGYEPGFSAVGFEGSSLPGVGVEAGYVEAEESVAHAADKVG